ncbi:MAG TPA: SPOR domain-containing protein [Candidatus Binataceae bacterium]|nr:SPOR domain-containing protein [Candidatus Binataceae bacterium]
MRFEIRTGGMIAILVGIAVLSGSVFLLGILAGYDIGRETQNNAAQVATDYTLESSPPAAAPTPEAVAASSVPSAAAGETASNPNPVASIPAAPTVVARASVAATAVPAPKPTKAVVAALPPSPAAEEENAPPEEDEPAAATPAPTPPPKLASNPTPVPHRKPFNIQIQAAMDSASAGQMIKRLHILGYQPHTVPTTINGQTWYKVEIGPYATQAEAATAEAELRQKYNAMFAHPAAANPAPGAGGQDE